MADTAIAITAGTGTNVDTRTEATNGNHRQVVVLGDPATNAGVAPVDVTSGLKVNLGADNDVVLGAGTAEIGKLAAGVALIGKVGIDQATANANEVVLKASSAAIGKLTANTGVDIGDVDILTTPLDGSINGPGEPTVDSYTQVGIAAVTGANQSLISAPGASKQIWVYGIEFGNTTAGTVAFQDEDDTVITGVMPFADNGGMAISPSGNFAMPLWKVATNKALEADVVTGTINGSITYGIVSI